jgi:hypothetical protein
MINPIGTPTSNPMSNPVAPMILASEMTPIRLEAVMDLSFALRETWRDEHAKEGLPERRF